MLPRSAKTKLWSSHHTTRDASCSGFIASSALAGGVSTARPHGPCTSLRASRGRSCEDALRLAMAAGWPEHQPTLIRSREEPHAARRIAPSGTWVKPQAARSATRSAEAQSVLSQQHPVHVPLLTPVSDVIALAGHPFCRRAARHLLMAKRVRCATVSAATHVGSRNAPRRVLKPAPATICPPALSTSTERKGSRRRSPSASLLRPM